MADLSTVPMRTRAQWGAVHDYSTARPVEKPASQLFLHITVTRPSDHASNDAHARYVEKIGIRRFGIGISYNALVMPGGVLYEGQPPGRRGAHTVNDRAGRTVCPNHGGSLLSKAGMTNLNFSARAIALARMVTDAVTVDDVEAVAQWGAALIREGHVERGARWHGHTCASAKNCPGATAYNLIPQVEARMNDILDGDEQVSRAREFALGLVGAGIDAKGHNKRISRLIDAGLISPKTDEAKKYWTDLVADPDSEQWLNFVNAFEVEVGINTSKQASGGVDVAVLADAVADELSGRLQA